MISISLKQLKFVIISNYMNFFKNKFIVFLLSLIFLSSCISLPGINKNPTKKKINKRVIENEYSIKDVINIIKNKFLIRDGY